MLLSGPIRYHCPEYFTYFEYLKRYKQQQKQPKPNSFPLFIIKQDKLIICLFGETAMEESTKPQSPSITLEKLFKLHLNISISIYSDQAPEVQQITFDSIHFCHLLQMNIIIVHLGTCLSVSCDGSNHNVENGKPPLAKM